MADMTTTEEEEADRLAGEHYESELVSMTCICGEPWICFEWIKVWTENDCV